MILFIKAVKVENIQGGEFFIGTIYLNMSVPLEGQLFWWLAIAHIMLTVLYLGELW